MALRILRRLPTYATGLGFALALAGVADARRWSDLKTAAVGLAVAAFYVVLILVPMLIREEGRRRMTHDPPRNVAVPSKNGGQIPTLWLAPVTRTGRTYGPAELRPSRPRVPVP
jgi:hypothetical protein